MKKTIITETDRNKVKKIHVSWNVTEANARLEMGWELMCGSIAHRGSGGFEAKPCFILVKRKDE